MRRDDSTSTGNVDSLISYPLILSYHMLGFFAIISTADRNITGVMEDQTERIIHIYADLVQKKCFKNQLKSLNYLQMPPTFMESQRKRNQYGLEVKGRRQRCLRRWCYAGQLVLLLSSDRNFRSFQHSIDPAACSIHSAPILLDKIDIGRDNKYAFCSNQPESYSWTVLLFRTFGTKYVKMVESFILRA